MQDISESYRKDPVFIMGCQRSGTTLVSQMLTNHSSLAIYHETFFYHIFYNELRYYGNLSRHSNLQRLVKDMCSVINAKATKEGNSDLIFTPKASEVMQSVNGNRFEDVIAAILEHYATACGKRRGGDKTPENYHFIKEIHKEFPGSPVIYVMRDPRDTVLSSAGVFGTSIEKGAMMWNDAYEVFSDNKESVLLVKYESLVADQEGVLKNICEHMGEEYDSGMLSFYEKLPEEYSQLNGRGLLGKPISTASVGKFHDMPKDDLRKIEQWCAEGMQAMGYKFFLSEEERTKNILPKPKKPSFLSVVLERLRYYGLNASRWQHGWPRWRLMIGHRLRYFSGLALLESLSSADKNQNSPD